MLISSAKDRLLNSLEEGARLERNLGNAMRVVLPKSGHTALLEVDIPDIQHSIKFSHHILHKFGLISVHTGSNSLVYYKYDTGFLRLRACA